jgi:hypothetical protein
MFDTEQTACAILNTDMKTCTFQKGINNNSVIYLYVLHQDLKRQLQTQHKQIYFTFNNTKDLYNE